MRNIQLKSCFLTAKIQISITQKIFINLKYTANGVLSCKTITCNFDYNPKSTTMKTKITTKNSLLSLILMLIATNISAQWTTVNNGLPATSMVGLANVRDTLFTAVKNHGVYYSVNNGDNWTAFKHNSKLATTNITKMEGLATFPTAGGGLFLNIYGQSMFDFYFSQGQGSAYLNYNVPNQIINSWVKEEDNGNEYDFVATNNGVYYSTDDKKTWTQSSGLTGDALTINHLNIAEYDDDSIAIFASTNNGVYKSTDMGVNFSLFTNGISADIKVYNQNLLVATSKGMYTYNSDNDAYTSFITDGDFRTSVLDYSTFVAYAFGDGIAKRINLANSAIEDITQSNITGGVIISTTYVKDFLFICTENGGVFRIPRANVLATNKYTMNKNNFEVYPNPSNGKITIKTDAKSNFEIYSITGKLLQTFKVKNTYSQNLNLSSGIYFVKNKNTHQIQKLLIK